LENSANFGAVAVPIRSARSGFVRRLVPPRLAAAWVCAIVPSGGLVLR
jgi:hypothetical protein